MESSRFEILLHQYIHDTLTDAEAGELLATLQDDAYRAQWEAAMEALLADPATKGHADKARMETVWAQLQPPAGGHIRRGHGVKWRWAAAAAILVAMATTGGYYLANHPRQHLADHTVHAPAPCPLSLVKPGTNKALLTLADGSQVALDSSGNGAIATQGNSRILQQGSGQLTYASDGSANGPLQYNNLHVPRGGQFSITLSDGTRVWLNAASDLRYPASFGNGERRVELSGEAYFEVKQQAAHPFVVAVNNMEIQVLGTNFNISAYNDESITRTTLLDGAVNVKSGSQETRLSPGQQAQVRAGLITVKDDADVEEAVAWKNGYFQFNHANIAGVMNQLSRWYDLDVHYEGNIPSREFGGRIARNSSIEDIIRILELSKIHVKIDNKKIIVMP